MLCNLLQSIGFLVITFCGCFRARYQTPLPLKYSLLICISLLLILQTTYGLDKEFESILSSTNAANQRLAGIAFLTGEQVPKNFSAAFKSFSAAAAQGDQLSQWWLAYCYEEGKGIPANETAADRIYLKLCNEGFTNAQATYGLKLSSRYVQSRDLVTGIQAYKWLALVASTDKSYADSRDDLAEQLPKPTLTFAHNLVIAFQPVPPAPLYLTNVFQARPGAGKPAK